MYPKEVLQKMQEIVDNCVGDAPPYCEAECPMHTDIKGYINLISEERYLDSIKLIREKLFLPATLGRICAHPCEDKCKRNELNHPMAVAALKRFASEYDNENDWDLTIEPEKDYKVAIIGAGPAGAQAALDLRKKGYKVTIYEKLPVVGGMMRVGIPEYRLPRNIIDFEYSYLKRLGIEIKLNTEIGKDITFSNLQKEFNAILIAVGAHKSVMIPIPGSDLKGVLPGVDVLREVSLTRKYDIGKKVAVIGGGNVAIDVARSLRRVGAEDIYLCCLEARDEMPAHTWEVEEAEEEGITVKNCWGPKEIVGKDGKVQKLALKYCKSVFDKEGKFNPTYDEDKVTEIEVDNVVLAIGQSADTIFLSDTGVEIINGGKVKVDSLTYETSVKGIFAAGDGAGRPLIAIEAMAQGRMAAESIDKYLKGQDLLKNREYIGSYKTSLETNIEGEKVLERTKTRQINPKERIKSFEEVDLGFTEEMAQKEAKRCFQCECKLCVKECLMLQDFCECPKDLFKDILETGDINPLMPYSCNMCNQCTLKCPKDFKLSEVFYDVRKEMVKEGTGPLKSHKPIYMHQKLGFSSFFNLTVPDKKAGFTKRVFIPGCSLPSYNPEIVGKTLKYLQEKLPGTGAILKCCGKPTKALGQMDKFYELYKTLTDEIEKLGADEIIVACQSCYATFKEYSPDKKVTSLWSLFEEIGVPEEVKGIGRNTGLKFAIHDSCVTRDVPEIHDGIRYIFNELGYEIEELPNSRENTRCCGFGGMIVPANPDLANRIMDRRAQEAESDYMVTYCAACRTSMITGGKKALHMLDLVFDRGWGKKEIPGVDGPLKSWLNRWKAKQELIKASK